MLTYFRDITSYEAHVNLSLEVYDSLSSFFGRARCIDVSKITTHGILDLNQLKIILNSLDIDASNYPVMIFYTGHHDRYYNTSLWNRSKPFITYSVVSYLQSIGVKNLCIDAPSLTGRFPLPSNLDMVFTLGLCNLGHLCHKDFIYLGFPVKVHDFDKKYILRAMALQAIL